MNLQDAAVMDFLDRCDKAGIRNPSEFLKSKMPVVYDYLKGAFPRGILPTDIDGEVEINGRFLRFEFKHESRVRSGAIPRGQLILFERLVSTGFHTVLLIGFDDSGDPVCVQIYAKGKTVPFREATKDSIRKICADWSEWVERLPRP